MTFVDPRALDAIASAVLHFLWQGAAFAAALALLLPFVAHARDRCAAACLALFAMPVAFVATFVSAFNSVGSGTAAVPQPPNWNWIAPVWLAGVAVTALYRLAGWIVVQRARRTGVSPAPQVWRERLRALAERLRVSRPVELLESSLAETPVVIGALRPVILMPAGLLARMPASQLEAILLHELAHVRRRDYLINLAQSAVESLLFYHPAVWWVSHVIRAERENACDDIAVGAQGDAHEYASALLALEETRQPTPALAATGGELMSRIRRLLQQPREPRSGGPAVLALLVGALCLAAVAQQNPALTKWLNEDVVYIIEEAERAAFERLTTDAERDRFVEEFWERRDPTPGTRENEFKNEHYRRIAYANDRFESEGVGWKSDRGRIYIKYGPPDEIEAHPNEGRTLWMYRNLADLNDILLEFRAPSGSSKYRLIGVPPGF